MDGIIEQVNTAALKMWHFSDLKITKKNSNQIEKSNANKKPISQNFVIIKRCSPGEVKPLWYKNMSHFNTEVLTVEMELCRVCLKPGKIPIHGDDPSKDLAQALSTFGGIDVSIFDSHPKYLCESCHVLLLKAMLFRKTAQSSDQLIKKSVPDSGTDTNFSVDNHMIPEPVKEYNCSDFPAEIVTDDLSILEPQVCLKMTDDSDIFKKPLPPGSAAHSSNRESVAYEKHFDLTCKQCEIRFSSVQDYKNHKLHTRKHKKKMCTVCKINYAVWFKKKYSLSIQKAGNTYVCDICYENKDDSLNKPITRSSSNQQPSTFNHQQPPETTNINQQPQTSTNFQQPLSDNISSKEHDKILEKQKVVLTCKKCVIEFDKFQDYREHKLYTKKHKKKMCAVCNNTYAARFIRKYSLISNMTGMYLCEVCYKKDLKDLTKELTDDNGNKAQKPKLKCNQCNLSFDTYQEYRLHKLSHGRKRKMCAICKQSFTVNYYRKHVQSHKAEGQIGYMCEVCGRHFKQRCNLTRHLGTHSSYFAMNLPYKCSICSYKTLLKPSLKIHMRSHTGERPYLCELCPKKFASKSNLIKHRYTHKKECSFKCECGKGYHIKRDLELHIKVDHVGIKEHVCQICGKAYGYRKVLMHHQIRVHKREKLKGGKQAVYLKFDSMKKQDKDLSTT